MSEHLFWMMCQGLGLCVVILVGALTFLMLVGATVGILAWTIESSGRGWHIIHQRWRTRA